MYILQFSVQFELREEKRILLVSHDFVIEYSSLNLFLPSC